MSDYALSGDFGDQLQIPGLGPDPGTRWRNIHTGDICVVVHLSRRRKTWVTVRVRGREREMEFVEFARHYRRYRPPPQMLP